MAKTSIAREVGQESSRREGLGAAIWEWVREVIEMVLQEEVEVTPGAGRSRCVVEWAATKPRKLTLRTGTQAQFADAHHGSLHQTRTSTFTSSLIPKNAAKWLARCRHTTAASRSFLISSAWNPSNSASTESVCSPRAGGG